MKRWCVGATQQRAQRPQRAAVAVVGTALFQPVALVVHEITKTSSRSVEGIPDKGEITRRQFEGLFVAEFLQESAHRQSARIVVYGVALAIIGHRENGVLKHARIVRHAAQVIEFERRELTRTLVERLDGGIGRREIE